MPIGDEEEAEVIGALLGGLIAYFVEPWGITQFKAILSGLLIGGGLTMIIGRLGDDDFTPGTAAVLGVLVAGFVMLGTAI